MHNIVSLDAAIFCKYTNRGTHVHGCLVQASSNTMHYMESDIDGNKSTRKSEPTNCRKGKRKYKIEWESKRKRQTPKERRENKTHTHTHQKHIASLDQINCPWHFYYCDVKYLKLFDALALSMWIHHHQHHCRIQNTKHYQTARTFLSNQRVIKSAIRGLCVSYGG